MRSRATISLCVLLAGLTGGCGGATSQADEGAPGLRQSRNVISAQELAGERITSALHAVRRFRPQWLRGARSVGGGVDMPVAYLDGVRYGDLNQLDAVPVEGIAEIRFISATDATTRFGTGHAAGAILVITHRNQE